MTREDEEVKDSTNLLTLLTLLLRQNLSTVYGARLTPPKRKTDSV